MKKFKLLYALIGILWGVFIGVLASMFSFAYLSRFLWIYVFGDNIWPSWIAALVIMMVLFIVLLCTALGLILGIKFGAKKELASNNNHALIHKKVFMHLGFSFILIVLSTGYLVLKSRTQKIVVAGYQKDQKIYEELLSHVKGVDDINIDQIENGIDIVVEINGQSKNKYGLSLNLIGRSYIKESIFQAEEKVEFNFPEQSFHFELLFDELSLQYRKALNDYVLNFSEALDVDEIFEVLVTVNLLETEKYNAERIRSLSIPPQKFSTFLRLNFSCLEEKCKIVQKKETEVEAEVKP